MADGGIGHQPLDVPLPDGREGAENHGEDRRHHDDLLPLADHVAEGPGEHADQQRDGRDLGGRGEEGGDRGRRALVDVGRPHVEGHGRDLEGQRRDHEDDAHDDAGGDAGLGRERIGQPVEVGRAGEAVNQRGAVEQHARGERAQDEVLQARFGRARVVAVEGGQDVERQREQLEPEIEAHQVVGRDHRHHADRGEEDEDRELEAGEPLLHVPVQRQQQAERGRGQRQQLHEGGEVVGDILPAEGRALGLGDDQHARHHECADDGHGAGEGHVLLRDDPDDEDGQSAEGQHQLRKGEGPVHQRPARRDAAPIAAWCCCTICATVAEKKERKDCG
jgi:hypothetical protein